MITWIVGKQFSTKVDCEHRPLDKRVLIYSLKGMKKQLRYELGENRRIKLMEVINSVELIVNNL